MTKINYQHSQEIHNTKDALEILPVVFKYIQPKSIVDIGCGNGSWLKASKLLGVETVTGVDGVKVDRKELLIEDHEFLLHDLTKPLQLQQSYDMAICLEVGEHLPKSSADMLISSLCTLSDVVLFSAAVPNQLGHCHINEQWPEYWHQKFKEHNFLAYDILRQEFWDHKKVFWWYSQNMIIYGKKGCLDDVIVPNKKVNALVHPSNYNQKITHPKYLKTKKELLNLIALTAKILLKKILKP